MNNHKNVPPPENINVSINKASYMNDEQNSVRHKLAQWQCKYNISQAAFGALLKILIDVDSADEIKNLPKDPRTLLNTPKNVLIRSIVPGEYFHYGLQEGIVKQLRFNVNDLRTNIEINVHIDGLPISKSSQRQLYPILGEIFPKIATPFVIGVYHGLEKPKKCDDFLEEFINEYNILHTEGFDYKDTKLYVTM